MQPIANDEICEGVGDIQSTLIKDLSFEDSCVDMDWGWEVEAVWGSAGDLEDPIGYRIRTNFQRPDRSTGKIERGWGRWHEVPLDPTVSGVVKTAYVACKMILEHELMEAFKWKGGRIFDPHNTVEELWSLNPRMIKKSNTPA